MSLNIHPVVLSMKLLSYIKTEKYILKAVYIYYLSVAMFNIRILKFLVNASIVRSQNENTTQNFFINHICCFSCVRVNNLCVSFLQNQLLSKPHMRLACVYIDYHNQS